jgi:tetratricopeptide (TPR) repeat protein
MLLGALGFIMIAGASAQQSSRRVVRAPLEQSLSAARRLLRQGHDEQGIQKLEELRDAHPGDLRVVLALGAAYNSVGEYLKAAELYRAEIERSSGRNADLWVQLADSQRRAGQGREAIETLFEALRRKSAWARRLADQFELAVTDSITGSEALTAMRSKAHESGAPRAWREALGQAYVVRGDFGEAISLLTALEREKQATGEVLFKLATSLARRGEPGAALAAFDSVLALTSNAGTAEETWFEKAEILAGLERPAEAAAAYGEMIHRFPRGNLAMRGRLRRGALLMGPLGDLGGARAAFQEVLDQTGGPRRGGPLSAIRGEALLGLGECALRSEDFALADTTYAQVEQEAVRTVTKEQAAYERAEILFYQGQFPEAEEAYYQLTDHYRNGQWVNDALDRALLLGEFALSSGPALTTYARVAYKRRLGAVAEGLALCRTALGDTTETALRAHLRLQEIQLCGELLQWAAADSALALLLAEDAGSRIVPIALFWMATAAEACPQRRHLAAQFYEDVILCCSDSLEARRARVRLRDLRAEEEGPHGA